MKEIFIISRGIQPVLAFESMESAINAKIQLEQEIGKIYKIHEIKFFYE